MHEEDRRMYELEYPAPVIRDDSGDGQGPTMIVAMHGYADAGQAIEASADHLKAALEAVSYTHLTLPTTLHECRSRWSPYH